MFRVRVAGVDVECDTADELKKLLKVNKKEVKKKQEQRVKLGVSLPYDDTKTFNKLNKKFTGQPKKAYTQEEMKRLSECTKISEINTLAEELHRTPQGMASLWYDIKKGVRKV